MKKVLLFLVAWVSFCVSHAQDAVITDTPDGTLYPSVYASSGKTYLLSGGGFGSFSGNSGYCSSIVINGDEMYIHNIISEYPGIDSWVKGRFVSSDVVEFEFPQPVYVNPRTGDTLYAAMMKGVKEGAAISLVPDTDSPLLRLSCNEARDSFSQIMPEATGDALPAYAGMIGLVDANGEFKSYGEQNVSYSIWNQLPQTPGEGLSTVSYTGVYTDQWNDSYKRLIQLGIDGNDAWISGLCEFLPDSWVKGAVQEDDSIVIDTRQYLGEFNNYFIFMCCIEKDAKGNYEMVPSMTLKPTEEGYVAEGSMAMNLGCDRVFLGIAVDGLTLTQTAAAEPIPVNPEFGYPEWDDNDGMGVADLFISPEDINGEALNPDNLYYRLYFDGELVAFDHDEEGNPVADIKYGTDTDFVMFMYDWHFIMFFEPLSSIGAQSVYKVDGKEYCSEIVTYNFPVSGVADIEDNTEPVSVSYWTMDGVRIDVPTGLCIRKAIYPDGSVRTSKLLK